MELTDCDGVGLFLDVWGFRTKVVSTVGDVVSVEGVVKGGSGDELFLASVLERPGKLDSGTSVLLLVVTPMVVVSEDE